PVGVGDAAGRVGFQVGEGVGRRDASAGKGRLVKLAAAGDGDGPHAGSGRRVDHADGGLAVQALLVQRAFAGDHQLGAGQVLVETDQLEQQVDAGPAGRAQYGQRGEADATGGSRARRVGHRRVDVLAPGAQRLVQEGDLGRV